MFEQPASTLDTAQVCTDSGVGPLAQILKHTLSPTSNKTSVSAEGAFPDFWPGEGAARMEPVNGDVDKGRPLR